MYIPRLSNRGIHANSILTKYLARNSANFTRVRTLVDPENSLPHLFAPKANLSVCAFIIADGVGTTSGVSSSTYPLTTMVTNYLALMLTEGSLTRSQDGQSSLVDSVEN